MANIELSILVAMYEPDVNQFNKKISHLIERLGEKINYEIIIHDDSSDLNNIVKYDNIHYQLNKTRLGIYQNYNCLLDAANGKYICFYDQDDYFEPDYFIEGIQFLTNNGTAELYCGECTVLSSVDESWLRTELESDLNSLTKNELIFKVIGRGESLIMHSIIKNDERFRFTDMIGADHLFNLLILMELEVHKSSKCYVYYYEDPYKSHADNEGWDISSSKVEFIFCIFYDTFQKIGFFLSINLLFKLTWGHKRLMVYAAIGALRALFKERFEDRK